MITKQNAITSGLEAATDSLDHIIATLVVGGGTLLVGTPLLRDVTQAYGGFLPADVPGSRTFLNARTGDRGVLATTANAGDVIGIFQGVDGRPINYVNPSASISGNHASFCRKVGIGFVYAGAVAAGTAVTIGSLLIVSSAHVYATVGTRTFGTYVGRVVAYPINTVIATAISSTGSQAVTPMSMNGITTSTQLTIDSGSNIEIVTPTAVTATTFTAPFALTHGANVTVQGLNNTPGATIIQVPGSGATTGTVLADINVLV